MSNELTNEVFASAPATSITDYAASTLGSPQPAWRTLDVARDLAFTGEIVFATAPSIAAYLDDGTVYYAERQGDPTLCQRLTQAGVVTTQQLERGVVRVGDAEHLGRLFDRDESIDRDAVMVVVEAHTEQIVSELAAGDVASVTVSAYRHHQSGVHRWFVAPRDTSLARPVSDVNQVDRSVVDDLPGLSAPVPSDVRIDWDQPIPPNPITDGPTPPERNAQTDLGGSDADLAAGGIPEPTAPTTPADEARSDDRWLDDFHIVWPDGTEESATPAPTPTTVSSEPVTLDIAPTRGDAAASTTSDSHEPPPAEAAAMPIPDVAAAPVDLPVDDGSGDVQFEMPAIVIDRAPAPDAAIPDDVAAAVRRALQAIEHADVPAASLSQLDLTPLTMPALQLPTLSPDDETAPAPIATEPVAEAGALAPPGAAPRSPFAPPTPDTRAEAMYARAAAAATAESTEADSPPVLETGAAAEALPEPGQTSVVFVDEDDEGGSSRRGALRRLIGSLRRD